MGVSRHRFVAKGQEMYRNKKGKHVKGVHSFCFCSSNMQNLCILQGPLVKLSVASEGIYKLWEANWQRK